MGGPEQGPSQTWPSGNFGRSQRPTDLSYMSKFKIKRGRVRWGAIYYRQTRVVVLSALVLFYTRSKRGIRGLTSGKWTSSFQLRLCTVISYSKHGVKASPLDTPNTTAAATSRAHEKKKGASPNIPGPPRFISTGNNNPFPFALSAHPPRHRTTTTSFMCGL